MSWRGYACELDQIIRLIIDFVNALILVNGFEVIKQFSAFESFDGNHVSSWPLWIAFQDIFFQPDGHLCNVWITNGIAHRRQQVPFGVEEPLVSVLGCVLEIQPLCALMRERQSVLVGPTERDPIKRQFHSMTRTPHAPHQEVLKTSSNSQAVALTGYESPQHRRYLRSIADSSEHQDDHSCW